MKYKEALKTLISYYGSMCQQFLRGALFCQLFLLLFSWPLLLEWGLPVSLLCIIGNIMWAPLMVLFLGLSTGIFVAAFVGIQYTFMASLLGWIIDWWLYFLSYGNPSALCAFAAPPRLVLVFVPVSALMIVWYFRKKEHQWHGCAVLACAILSWAVVFKAYESCLPRTTSLPLRGKELLLVRTEQGVWLVDRHGALAKTQSLVQWVQFNLKQELARSHGATQCYGIIEMQPTLRRLQAISEVLHRVECRLLVVPECSVSYTRNVLDRLNEKIVRVWALPADVFTVLSSGEAFEREKVCYTIEQVIQKKSAETRKDSYGKSEK